MIVYTCIQPKKALLMNPAVTASPHHYNIFATFHHHYTLYMLGKDECHKFIHALTILFSFAMKE